MALLADQRQVVAHQHLRIDIGGGALGCADAEIDVLADHPRDELVGRAVVHHHADLRVQGREAPQHLGQKNLRQRRGHRQADAAAPQRRQVAQPGAQRIDIAQDALGHHDGFARGLGRLQRAGGAVEQAHAQAFFHLPDQHAHRRLRDRQLLGRGAELAQLVDGAEGAQLAHGRREMRGFIHMDKS